MAASKDDDFFERGHYLYRHKKSIEKMVDDIVNKAMENLKRPHVYVGPTKVRGYYVKAHFRRGYYRAVNPRRRVG